MNRVKKEIKGAKKALIKLNIEKENSNQYDVINIDSKSPIYQAVKATPISELNYII